jgi:hypothetical protein
MKIDQKAGTPPEVVDLAAFRKKKEIAVELTKGGRNPLYVSHLTGKVSGKAEGSEASSPDFGDRLQRIRSSLEKINRLMADLKKMSADGESVPATSSSRSKI